MNYDLLIQKINTLESWLDNAKGQLALYPLRLLGYGALLLTMAASNFMALIRWPFASLFKSDQSENSSANLDSNTIHPVDAEQLTEILQLQKRVLVDFWAEWCGPCIMMNQPLQKIAASEDIDCIIAKVNTVSHSELAESYNVKGLPTLILFENGEEEKRYAGALSYAEIKKFIEN